MTLFHRAAIGALALTLTTSLVFAASSDYTKKGDGTIEYNKTSTIFLKTTSLDDTNKTLDFDNLNAEPPAECAASATACEETTEITVTTKKVWTPVKLASITSASLSASTFAKFFPNLADTNKLTNSSPQQQKLIAQKILYELGLLPVLPTGKVGYDTELAAIKLHCWLGISGEYDTKKNTAYLGAKSIAALNELKKKMIDPTYLTTNPVPDIDLASGQCGQVAADRAATIATLKATAKSSATSNKAATQQAANSIPTTAPNYLQLEGQVTIKKSE